jgi:hypothetical protein
MSNNDVKEDKEKEEKNNEIKIKESDAPYYSDEERNIYKIKKSSIISEISIIKVKKNIPPNRCYLTAEYSKNNNSIICIGGSDDKCNQYNKITEYDISKNIFNFWKCDNQSEMDFELSGHSSNLIFLDNKEKIFIFGGYDNWKKEFTSQSYLIDIKMRNFEKINYYISFDNNNEYPLPRTYHSSNYDKKNNLIYIYGGTDMNITHCKGENFQVLWKFNLERKIWIKIKLEINALQIKNDGPPRGHTSILLDNKLYIFGGVTLFKKFQNSMYIIYLQDKKLEKIDYNNDSFKKGSIPEPMAFHSAVLLNSEMMFINGGLDKQYNALNSCYIYYINEMKFDKIEISLIPNLFSHKIVMNHNKSKLYIIGGMDAFKYVGDENLSYKIEKAQDFIFNKKKVEYFPMKNILEIKLNEENAAEDKPEGALIKEDKIKNNDRNSNKRIKWKKLFI